MTLDDITEFWIEQFAGSKIFERGVDYHQSGHVYSLEYNPDLARIQAEVAGNYGNYLVEITEEKAGLKSSCDCPYDGYPCKHVVAVLLAFISNRSQYLRDVDQQKKPTKVLPNQLMDPNGPILHDNLSIIEVTDSITLDMLISDVRTGRYILTRLSERMAVIEPDTFGTLVEVLQKDGHTPKILER